MHRKGVAALIINESNQFLLVNLSTFEEFYYAVPGGGIELGEGLEDAVMREINEELGISIDKLEIIGKARNPIKFEFKSGPLVREGVAYTGQEKHYFLVRFTGKDKDIKINEEEVRKYVWADYDDLHKYLLFEGQLADTRKLIEELSPQLATKAPQPAQ